MLGASTCPERSEVRHSSETLGQTLGTAFRLVTCYGPVFGVRGR